MTYSNEYEYLIGNIKSGKSPEQLSQEAETYELDGNKVLDIIQELFQEGLLTSPNVPSLYKNQAGTGRLISTDWDKAISRLKQL
ncbi:hypothetical protein [Lactiplantibacillus plantarum]|uniref:hypothetical protein n=1 Tax=Lactiplantibacillus plantarum TaxID=1590 RepID=UPI0007E3C871|nr:hypothetical protein [Lactiplantibacillus plantarum]ANJ12775.1 hypothetical protein A8704_01580 [Lactiplantibacillus plantarum]MCB7175697.1 hypothetical protein [Lactiplantibacillus plantarum]